MRKVADVQLSGNGYRKNNKVLDGARALFESGSLADFLKYSGDYDEIASKVLDLGGKIIYGPQNQGSLNKNATNVHKRFSGLMNEVESAATPSLSLADLKTGENGHPHTPFTSTFPSPPLTSNSPRLENGPQSSPPELAPR